MAPSPNIAVLAAASLCVIVEGALFDALSSAKFLHQGIVNNTDVYRYMGIACGYLEPENVTAAQSSWGEGGSCPYLFNYNTSIVDQCNASPTTQGFDLPGNDYRNFAMPQDNFTLCEQTCCDEAECLAWVYSPSAPAVFESCQVGDHCCYLKSSVPTPKAFPGLFSGTMNRSSNAAIPPPFGMRSAVPLGGLGAGAVELRADGSFHEWTIVNQSPAGAAKFGVIADAFLALKIATAARAIRTNPPSYAQGVAQTVYSGAYPLSRLAINDPVLTSSIPATVYAYSTLVPGDMSASGYPSIMFTATLTNPTSTASQASFMFNLPFGAINDCNRPSKTGVIATVNASSYGDCLTTCASTFECASWSFDSMTGTCNIANDVPWSVHATGFYCGVQGGWNSGVTGGQLNLVMHPAGGAEGPSNGDISILPVLDTGVTVSVGVANDPSALYNSFATSGGFVSGNGIIAAGSFTNITAAHGAVAVTSTLPPNSNTTLSLVFSWYFPDRDHMGVDIGNYYSNIWDNSAQVGAALAHQDTLTSIVENINTHHAVFTNENSSLPEWISDHMVNQMSHFRGLIWTKDGRLREFEANDCPDVDSIHNDYQRHLPYLWMAPEVEDSKLRKWGSGQASDGHIWEYLGSFGLGPLDVPGGRIMGDTTTLWIMEVLEMYHNTGDTDFLLEMYPTVTKALEWIITNAQEIGLPWQLVCTYDIINFQQYNTSTFNSFLYLATMKAGIELAGYVNDTATITTCTNAFLRGQSSITNLLWNTTYNYFRAYTGGEAIMGDCLYGQVVAHHHGLGWLMPQEMISQHILAEWKYNQNPYGLTVVTGRNTPPPQEKGEEKEGVTSSSSPSSASITTLRMRQSAETSAQVAHQLGVDTTDDTVWMGSGPDMTYVAMSLDPANRPWGDNITAALEPARRAMDNWRARLKDMWNIAGLTSTGDWGTENQNGQPWITSHYGFLLVDYYLVPGFSGQQTNIANGTVSFNPQVISTSCPFNFPALFAGSTGTISCDASGTYTFALAFGSLTLPAGGLSVSGNAYPNAVDLVGGQSVSW